MITLNLDYSQWRCGVMDESYKILGVSKGTGDTHLKDKDTGLCCCLGLMLLAAGVPENKLMDVTTPEVVDIEGEPLPEKAMELFHLLLRKGMGGLLQDDSQLTMWALEVNDGTVHYSRPQDYKPRPVPLRMAQLTHRFAQEGVTLNWTHVPDDEAMAYRCYMEELQKD